MKKASDKITKKRREKKGKILERIIKLQSFIGQSVLVNY